MGYFTAISRQEDSQDVMLLMVTMSISDYSSFGELTAGPPIDDETTFGAISTVDRHLLGRLSPEVNRTLKDQPDD